MTLPKTYHMAKLISKDGDVSPLCAKTPRKLNLKKALWCLRPQDVTCRQCKALLKHQQARLVQEMEG